MSEHGTRSKYVEGCHCPPCTEANRVYGLRYERSWRSPDVWGETTNLVSAEPVRQHLLKLRDAGVGRRQVERLTGLGESCVYDIARGETKRVRPETADLILAVSENELAPSSLVDAAPTWKLVDEMVRKGIRKYRIAHALGNKRPALQLGKTRITKRQADAIEQLYEDWMSESPGRRFDRAPLLDYLQRLNRLHTQRDIAARLGFSLDTYRRSILQRSTPISEERADEFCCRLNLDPRQLWPEWDEVAA